MRVMFAVFPGPSHVPPVVPLAWALRAAGHEVVLVSHPGTAGRIEGTGLAPVALGEPEDLAASVRGCAADPRMARIVDAFGLDPADPAGRSWIGTYLLSAFRHYYLTDQAAGPRAMTRRLTAFARQWRPDLVLWDPLFFPAPLAARACGAAHARVLWGLDHLAWARQRLRDTAGTAGTADPMAELMAPVLDEAGIDFAEDLLAGQWTIDPMPARMRLPVDLPYLTMRRIPFAPARVLPEWLSGPPERPRICLTLGHGEGRPDTQGARLVRAVVDAVAGLDVELVATLTSGQAALAGPLPDNVRTVDYVSLDQLLPSCAAVVHHGGGGTFAAAVAHRVPQLIAPPEVGDYAAIARYVAGRGAGAVLDGATATAADIREQLTGVLHGDRYRAGVTDLYAELLAAPAPGDLVPVLERLTRLHRERPAARKEG
ncbi:nucleotide disphospho-sugar-binding domain-containing protein [Kitasatospora sp. NPDC096077]|uniref:nucleotide disphospho-sugar-binding domain-containing protein n=1 Tax=Kitasatospora sp. NPDC096077 TaxID=3155544 RepID=UPI0033189E54